MRTNPNFILLNKAKKKDQGQALVEYSILLGVAAAISLGLSTFFNGFLNQGITKFNAVLEQDLKTGNFPEADKAWEN